MVGGCQKLLFKVDYTNSSSSVKFTLENNTPPHSNNIWSLMAFPGTNYFASACPCGDGYIRVWDYTTVSLFSQIYIGYSSLCWITLMNYGSDTFLAGFFNLTLFNLNESSATISNLSSY